MKTRTTSQRLRRLMWCLLAFLPLYLLSTGPIAWATNNGYLPDAVEYIYLPLTPLMKIECINELHTYYTAVIWHGFPYGHTTL
jgi:hypothetical protein